MDIYFNNALIGTTTVQCSVTLPKRIDYYTSHKVNDEVRGYLIYNGAWSLVATSSVQRNWKIKKIALILESPHKDEYQQNSFTPKGPAKGISYGTAGYSIDHFLANRKWVNTMLNLNYVYEVYIMNAIPYQCSAHNYIGQNCYCRLTKKERRDLVDEIFMLMWKYICNTTSVPFFQNDLIDRIDAYTPDIIINCCTKGNVKPPLQMHVYTALSTHLSGIILNKNYREDIHPAKIGKGCWK